MLRLKALFRARGIRTRGKAVYQPAQRAEWLAQLPTPGARFRADVLYAQLDCLLERRPAVQRALLAEAKRDPAWALLRTIPAIGRVRAALLVARMPSSHPVQSCESCLGCFDRREEQMGQSRLTSF
jgi:hypothetical protein